MIARCIQLIEKNGDKLDLDFPITRTSKGKFKYNVNHAAELRFKRDIFFCTSVKKLTEEQKQMTAEQLFR